MRTALRQSRIAGFDTLGGVSWRRDKTTLGLCDVFPKKSKFGKKVKVLSQFHESESDIFDTVLGVRDKTT